MKKNPKHVPLNLKCIKKLNGKNPIFLCCSSLAVSKVGHTLNVSDFIHTPFYLLCVSKSIECRALDPNVGNQRQN